MITIKLDHRLQIDSELFDKWCKERRIGRGGGRIIIKEKFAEICDSYLKEQNLKKDDRQSLGNLQIPIAYYYDGGERVYNFYDMEEEFNYQVGKLKEKNNES